MSQTAGYAFVGLGNDDHKVGRAVESVASVYGCPAVTVGVRPGHCPQVSNLIREIVANPFGPVSVNPSWLTSDAVVLANGIYADRAFDRLPILADALQDAGCDSDDLLTHLRDNGPHVLGCWALDLVLGKS